MWQNLTFQIFETQRQLHEQLVTALQEAASDPAGAWWIIALSFLYGLFHAAGPGHGKVIVTTYLATQPTLLTRGVALASLGALCQGLTAILLVYGLVFLVGSLVGHTDQAVDWSERLSFTLIFALGLWLMLRGLRTLRQRAAHHGHQHKHDHQHDHEHTADGTCCGHAHAPDADQISKAGQGLGAASLVILSMGLRPCTGAILVLVFASVLGATWLGIMAVIAMSTGTAMAVSLLAIATILARRTLSKLASQHGPARLLTTAQATILITGGLILSWLGGTMLYWSFNAPTHPLQL